MTFGFGKHCGRIFIAHMAIHKTKFFSFYSYILLYVDYAYITEICQSGRSLQEYLLIDSSSDICDLLVFFSISPFPCSGEM